MESPTVFDPNCQLETLPPWVRDFHTLPIKYLSSRCGKEIHLKPYMCWTIRNFTSGNWQLVHKLGCLLSLGILDMPKNATSTTKLRHQHVSAMVVPRLLWSWYGLLLGSSLRRVNTKDLRSKAGVPYFIFTDKNPPAPLGMVASEDTHPLRSWAFSLRHHQHQKHIWFSKIIW